MMSQISTWFIPSFYGDIRLEPVDAKTTRLIAEKLTPLERNALATLAAYAEKKDWGTFPKELLLSWEGTRLLRAPLVKVVKQLTKALKPGRTMISAVKFAGGQMEEIHAAAFTEVVEEAKVKKDTPYRTAPAKALSVAAPTIGCPAPDFVKAEIKAREVLAHFLTPQQLGDFQAHNRFIAQGVTTGHHYVICSRYAKTSLATFQRSLYDLDDKQPLCVHDWTVPAAEEMLALLVCVSLPGHEQYVRHLE